jgi:hypothetical protein
VPRFCFFEFEKPPYRRPRSRLAQPGLGALFA